MKVLINGGMGYVGSHTVVELANQGCECIVVDNQTNDWRGKLGRMQKISEYPIRYVDVNLSNQEELMDLFERNKFNAVVHLHERNLVEPSLENPLLWHEKAIQSTAVLLDVMDKAGVNRLIFSSPIRATEQSLTSEWNPYDRTNAFIEEMLQERSYKNPKWRIAMMNYSTPFGAHPSGMIGHETTGHPDGFIALLLKVAKGERKRLPLPSDSGMADFIHVVDLANAHSVGLNHLVRHAGSHQFVVRTGQHHSALDIVQAFEEASGMKIPYHRMKKKLSGSSPIALNYVKQLMPGVEWKAEHGLAKMCEDAWRWENEYKKLVVLD